MSQWVVLTANPFSTIHYYEYTSIKEDNSTMTTSNYEHLVVWIKLNWSELRELLWHEEKTEVNTKNTLAFNWWSTSRTYLFLKDIKLMNNLYKYKTLVFCSLMHGSTSSHSWLGTRLVTWLIHNQLELAWIGRITTTDQEIQIHAVQYLSSIQPQITQ